jgi:hypothetical protein
MLLITTIPADIHRIAGFVRILGYCVDPVLASNLSRGCEEADGFPSVKGM